MSHCKCVDAEGNPVCLFVDQIKAVGVNLSREDHNVLKEVGSKPI